jgi:hypothetical protein
MIRIPGILFPILFLLPVISPAQDQDPAEQLRSLMESCRFSQALDLTELYLARDTSRCDLLLVKGQALSSLFRYREAARALEKAQQCDSTARIFDRLLNERVNIYRLSGDHRIRMNARQ